MKENYLRYICILLLTVAVGCGEEDDAKKTKKKDSDAADLEAKVIYGEDDRLDLYQVQSTTLLSLADSTVALMAQSDLETVGVITNIKTTPFWDNFRLPLCEDERFREQDTAAFCSGFLVAPNLVATAGHCVQTQGAANSDCSTTRFVFGFNISREGTRPLSVPTSEIYSCKKIVAHKLDGAGADYSLIELDRNVAGHRPLKVRRSGSPQANDGLTVIGHPSGLPTKVAGNALVRRVNSSFLVASLDTYGGNSGSAVFNSATNEVEGILVRGENDFVVRGSCTASKKCAQDACRGEDVTLISEIAGLIPAIDDTDNPPKPSEIVYQSSENLSIPDKSTTGVTSVLTADQVPAGREVQVAVDITHTWRGDLVVELTAPNGAKVILSNRTGRSADDIVGVYGVAGTNGATLAASEDMSALRAVDKTGRWTLTVRDLAARDVGALNSWSLIFK